MIPYAVQEISPKDGIGRGVRRNNWVYNNSQTDWSYDIAPKYTDEMIADGDTLILSYNRLVKGTYYIQFAVIPYENTFDLAVNIFKSQQGDIGTGGGGDSYTKAQTDALLSAKADATKQLPADLTSWITDGNGWYAEYEDSEGDLETRDFTKLTTGFYDISPYCDYSVSAQYVDGWDGYYYTTRLFSYCTNGKTVFCH